MENKLSEPVLVLNKMFQAIHVIDARKAVSLLYQEVAEAIDDTLVAYPFSNWVEKPVDEQKYNALRSPSVTVMIPHVIRLTGYDKLPARDVMFNRKNIYARDKNRCQYCGKYFKGEDLTFDHVVPRSKGGDNSFENVVTCCVECNRSKANRTPTEAGMRLIKPPAKPRWRSYVKIPFSRLKERKMQIWKEFLRKPLWNLENRDE